MPKLGNIPLVSDGTGEASGAAFTLVSPAKGNALLALDNAVIEVRRGQPNVVVRFTSTGDPATAFAHGHQFAQQGLDLMSVLGRQDALIQDAEDEHALWWTEADGLVVRLVSTTILELAVGSMTAVVHDKEGNVIPQATPQPRHHIGFRYYRLAQVTDDLFDAFRNMYLAFEALLSTQYPIAKGEREIDWLRRALSAGSATLPLGSLRISPEADPVEYILDAVYKDTRLPLFHAKEGREYFPPQDSPTDREVVSRALGVLTHIVIGIANSWYDARRQGGGFFFSWIYNNVKSMLTNASVCFSNHDGPYDPNESDLSHPRFEKAVKAACKLSAQLGRGREPAIFASVRGTDVSSLNRLRRIEVVTPQHPVIAHILEAELECSGTMRLEALIHVRAMNLNQPKSLFRR
ncbi:MAG TPA: hypothetical protein VF182_16740 [Candidatus Binatia bacterium]